MYKFLSVSILYASGVSKVVSEELQRTTRLLRSPTQELQVTTRNKYTRASSHCHCKLQSHQHLRTPRGQESRNAKGFNTPYSLAHPLTPLLQHIERSKPIVSTVDTRTYKCATAQCSHYEREMASKRARRSQARLTGLTANCTNTVYTSNKTHRPCLLRRGIHFGWRV